jgi:DNA modification methylase
LQRFQAFDDTFVSSPCSEFAFAAVLRQNERIMSEKNQLYFGDNLDVLRRYVADESVDLVYLDPPFNSNASYNVLFKEHDGAAAASQIQAFEDTWRWDENAARAYQETVEAGGKLSQALQAFRNLVGESDMLAYLAMMAPRLQELRRVLKSSGSIYLHCDPTASHYLKLLMDAVFGPRRFGTEIVWKRSSAHSDTKQGRKLHGHIHDIVLFYTRNEGWTWNPLYTPYDMEYVDSFYRHVAGDTGRRYRLGDLTAARPGGDTSYEWRVKRRNQREARWEADLEDEYLSPMQGWEYHGVRPYKGRFWAYSKANMREYAAQGRLYYSKSGIPSYIRYLDEMPGVPLQDIWADIPPIGPGAAERLGYPTQKPLALLERIVASSSGEGQVVLDPFCGCGTTIDAAQKLGRRWIGIDITHLAINLIRHRLQDTYGEEITKTYEVIGEPTSVPDARVLAAQDPYQFQWWALGLVGARPVAEKKGADKGIDGRLFFHDEPGGKTKQIIFSVKAGKTNVAHVRDLCHVVDREGAQMGVLISMHPNTQPMRAEAADMGAYESPWGKHPKIQLLTVTDLLKGKRIDMPPATGVNVTFKKAPKNRHGGDDQPDLLVREE